jgi:hypothetical protein
MPPQRPVFVESLTADQIARIETTMRDRHFSESGFLGPDESLVERIRLDGEELRRYGVTYEQIADRLEAIAGRAERARSLQARSIEHQHRREVALKPFYDALSRASTLQETGAIAESMLDWWHEQERTLERVTVEDRYEVDMDSYAGWQDCPFDPADPSTGFFRTCGQADTDVTVRRVADGSTLFFSKLLIHLVREHHFFEGKGLRYRLEPGEAIRVLDIRPGVDYRDLDG